MRKNILTLILFVGLTTAMNYPRSINLANTLDETGDSLLNTWILSWNVHKLTTDLNGYFDGNIFYPHKKVLAYSEYLFASALLALPVIYYTKNPILGYNFVWFLSFVLSGWGMYLLVNYLIKNRLAGIMAGIIFAFFPFR